MTRENVWDAHGGRGDDGAPKASRKQLEAMTARVRAASTAGKVPGPEEGMAEWPEGVGGRRVAAGVHRGSGVLRACPCRKMEAYRP